MLKANYDNIKDAGFTNLIVHVKLSQKNISPIFSKVYGKDERETGFIHKLKSLINVDKLIN